MIRAITRQGSVTANQICPFRLCGARRRGDPDLPVSAQLHPSLSVCVDSDVSAEAFQRDSRLSSLTKKAAILCLCIFFLCLYMRGSL